jgi:hypothetical protein
MGDDVIKEFEVVVAGDSEDFANAELYQAVQQVVTDGVAGSDRLRNTNSHDDDGTRLRSKTPSPRRYLAIVRTWQSTKPAR